MTRINTNIGSTRGLRNLNKANSSLDTALQRLSTGSQINKGSDNPSGLIGGEKLRFQVTTIEQSIKNSNRASNVIATADGALGEISGLLNQVRGLVQEGLNQGALSSTEIEANQLQIDAALSAINRISSNTTFAGDKLLDGSKSFVTSVSSSDAAKLSDFQVHEALPGSNSSIAINATVTSAAEKAELRYSGGTVSSATTLEVAGAKGSQVLNFDAGSTVTNISEAINAVRDTTGVTASVINSAPGSLTVSNATAGSLAVGNTLAASADLTTAGSINVSRDARANSLQRDSVEGNSQLNFRDARATASLGADADLGGSISVELLEGTNGSGTSVTGVSIDGSGNYTISIELGDTGGTSTTTRANIAAAIAAHSGAAALITVDDTATGGFGAANGADTYAAAASAALTGGQNTENNDVSFVDVRPVEDRGDYNVAVEFLATAPSQSLSVAVNTNEFGDRTVSITLATDANGNVTSTADDIETLVNADGTANVLLSATASGDGSGVVQAASPAALSDVTNSGLTITDGRATDSTATFDDPLAIVLANSGASQTLSAGFAASGDGGTLTVTLATDADGNVTSTAAEIRDLLANNADSNISQYQVAVSGDGSGVVQAFSSTDLAGADDLDDSDLTFTDLRATNSVGEFDTSISTQFVANGENQSLSAAVTQDAEGNKTITFSLATDASGNVTSTAADVADFLANDTSAGAVEARGLVSVDASGDGSGVLQTKGVQSLTGGADGANNDVTFTDVRTDSPTNAINVAFVDPSGNDQALSVSVGVDLNGDNVITVSLATGTDGAITTTAAQLADFINSDSSSGAVAARALVSADASGDGSAAVAARDSAALTASSGSDVLVLSSSKFGSAAAVEVKALSGSFAATLADGTTAATRDVGADIGVQINGQRAQSNGLKASIKTGSLDASISFTDAANTVSNTASITINGGGATFQIGQEVSAAGQLGIGIESVNTARLGGISGKLFELGSGGGKSLLDVGAGQSGADLVNIVDEALNRVSTLRGRLGALQKNVIETNIATLGVALENISEARSQIVDTDFAVETANLTKAQILSQAGISVLSIANQQPQQVLALLG
jgi:flagellin